MERVCLVTGANSGIGKETAVGLVLKGYHVVMACRNREKAEAALADIKRQTGTSSPELLDLDLASFSSVRKAAADFIASHDRLDVLVNNAGLILTKRSVTVDGYETTFQVNYLSHFLLTHLLLATLKRSVPSRIVNVSSDAHTTGRIHFDDLQLTNGYNAFKSYGQSKLAQVLFTHELARRLQGSGVDAYAVHPGAVATNWGVGAGSWLSIGVRIAHPFEASPKKGARTSLYVASDPSLQGTSGRYYTDARESRSSDRSYDGAVASRLWDVSCQMLGIAPESF